MKIVPPLVLALSLAVTAPVFAADDCPPGKVCISPEDMQKIIKVLQERQCLDETPPTFTMDPIRVTVDQEGRYYYTGSVPKPYQVSIKWCHYTIMGIGKVELDVAIRTPEVWGTRFRPKAHLSYLPIPTLQGNWPNGIDVGVGADFLYYKSLNLGALVGMHGVSVGPGYDLTKNFGLYGGYEVQWLAPHHGLALGAYFAF